MKARKTDDKRLTKDSHTCGLYCNANEKSQLKKGLMTVKIRKRCYKTDFRAPIGSGYN